MWWWAWGTATGDPDPGTPVTVSNAPSLWSGGVRWGDPAGPFNDGTDAYWGGIAVATGRTGTPHLSVAIGGGLVLEQLQSANWTLGRRDWLSTLTPTSASFTFVDKPIVAINDAIVVGLMSESEEYHSDALWVGRVASFQTREEISGLVFTTINATDVIGILGQADAPASIPAGHTLVTLVEDLAADAGVALQVDTDPLVTLPTLTAATGIDGKVIDLINRAERSSNALLFLKGSGRLYAAVRNTTGASSVRVVSLDGDDSPSAWGEETSVENVVTRWNLGNADIPWTSDTEATTLDEYGDHTYSATDLLITDPVPYAALIASDVMAHPRAILVDAPFPVRDMGQRILFINPLDRVSRDGTTWQVMSVDHSVVPLRLEGDGDTLPEWRVSITGDATQEALAGATDPGPVTPPGLHHVTSTFTSTKSAWVEVDGLAGGGADGVLYVGRFLDGNLYRSYIEFPIVWPANLIRVVSAELTLRVESRTSYSRMYIQRVTESWSEGSLTWGGPSTTADDRRTISIDTSTTFKASITTIAEKWRATGTNDGIHLRSVDEARTDRRVSFYSDDAGIASFRPSLTIICEVVA